MFSTAKRSPLQATRTGIVFQAVNRESVPRGVWQWHGSDDAEEGAMFINSLDYNRALWRDCCEQANDARRLKGDGDGRTVVAVWHRPMAAS